MEIGMGSDATFRHKTGRFLWALFNRLVDHDCSGLAAEAAYRFLLSFIPSLIFLIALTSTIGISKQSIGFISHSMARLLPAISQGFLDDAIRAAFDNPAPGLLTTSLLITLWTASGTLATFTKALNRAFKVPATHHTFWRALIIPVVLLPVVAVPISLAGFFVVAGSAVATALAEYSGAPFLATFLDDGVWWVSAFLLVLLIVTMIYRISVAGPVRILAVLPGSLSATTLWFLVSLGFRAFTQSHFAHYEIYGSLTAIVVFLFWVYLGSFVFILGAEINAEIEQMKHIPAKPVNARRARRERRARLARSG